MARLTEIIKVEERTSRSGGKYKVTIAKVGSSNEHYDGEILEGYGEFEVGQTVEVFFDDRWDRAKFQKPRHFNKQ